MDPDSIRDAEGMSECMKINSVIICLIVIEMYSYRFYIEKAV